MTLLLRVEIRDKIVPGQKWGRHQCSHTQTLSGSLQQKIMNMTNPHIHVSFANSIRICQPLAKFLPALADKYVSEKVWPKPITTQ